MKTLHYLGFALLILAVFVLAVGAAVWFPFHAVVYCLTGEHGKMWGCLLGTALTWGLISRASFDESSGMN